MNKKIFELIKNGKVKKEIPFDFSGTSYVANGDYINNRTHTAACVGFACYNSWNIHSDVYMTICFPQPLGGPITLRVEFNGLIHGYLNNSRIVLYYTDNTTETLSLGTVNLNYNRSVTSTQKHKQISCFNYFCTYFTGAGGQSSNAGVNIYPVTQTVWK